MKFQGACRDVAIGDKLLYNSGVQVELTGRCFSLVRDSELYAPPPDGVKLQKDFHPWLTLFEVLVNDIGTQTLSDQMKLPISPKINTQRLELRRLKYEDADEIFYTYASKPEATKFVSWPTHRKLTDTRAFLEYTIHAWETGTDYSFAIRVPGSNRFIGTFGLMNDEGKVQFGYALGPNYWGQGYATEVCRAMMTLLKGINGLYRVGTLVDVENVASSRVLLKSGLIEEARLPMWMRFVNQDNQPKDCILYRLPLQFQ
jgi:ribosomal-protein-alanine N-acetyltransferase